MLTDVKLVFLTWYTWGWCI